MTRNQSSEDYDTDTLNNPLLYTMAGNQSPLYYDTETLQITLYSTLLQVIRASWTRTLRLYSLHSLYTMTSNQSPLD